MKKVGKAIKKVGKMAVNAKTAKARAVTSLAGKAASAVGAKKIGGALQNVAKKAKLSKGGKVKRAAYKHGGKAAMGKAKPC
jgi:hypothetical protein